MNVQIEKIGDFINSIHDYILETFEITPRDFETTLLPGEKSLLWNRKTGEIHEFDCPLFGRHLHVHDKDAVDEKYVVCCSQVDIIALRYLNGSIFGNEIKTHLINTLHHWLPSATFQNVKVRLAKKSLTIHSYFEPSYLFYLLPDIDKYNLVYNYLHSNIVSYDNYNLSETNMVRSVRRRSRSRSQSQSQSSSSGSGGGRRRGTRRRSSSRGRSRSRSQSSSSYGGQRRQNRRRSSSRGRRSSRR